MKLFRSKILYIILLVIFTLILAATLIIRFAVPSGPSFGGRSDFGTPPNFGDSSDFGTPPDFGSDSDSGMHSGFTPPEGFDMPEGFTPSDDFSMPSDFTKPEGASDKKDSEDSDQDTSDNDSGRPQRPGGSDSFPSGRSGSRSGNGFLSTVRKIWIPIVIVCVLIDAFCIFMLIRLSKRSGSKDDPDSGASGTGSDEPEQGKKGKKALLLLLVIPVLAIAIILNNLPQPQNGITSSVEVKENLIKAEAVAKTLSTVFLSGGTLKEEDEVKFSLPGDVEIESYAVSNGDTVEEGDLIANVNKASVMTEIKEIEDLIADLDELMVKSSEEDDYKKITSPAAGRVKAIYAAKGVSVADTMAQNGALILLSLDGLMKVEFTPKTALNVGDKVTVRLSDSVEKSGRVAEVTEESVKVTLTDKKTELGDKVSVLTEDGTVIGTGELEINSCLKITGYQGIISKVCVEVGDYVEADDDLLKLSRTVHSTEYDQMADQREELEEQMNKLFDLYKTGKITAEGTGVISGLDEDIPVVSDNEELTPIKEKNGYSTMFDSDELTPDVPDQKKAQDKAEDKSKDAAEPTEPKSGDKSGDKSKDKTEPTEPKDTTEPTKPADTTDPTEPANPTKPTDNTNPTDNTKPADNTNPTNPTDGSFPTDQTRPSGGDFPSGMPTGTDGAAAAEGYTDQAANTYSESDYEVSDTEIYSILPQDVMTVDISVDELDIGSINVGGPVIVSLDSLPGQSFEGKIVSVDKEGTYDSGNTKYTVTVSVARTEQMYAGMNAGIKIDTSGDEEYLTVPAAALTDEGGKTYVYTGYNEEENELEGKTEVTTGLSDGEDVEITSGLKAGDEVCYRYADTIEYTFVRK